MEQQGAGELCEGGTKPQNRRILNANAVDAIVAHGSVVAFVVVFVVLAAAAAS